MRKALLFLTSSLLSINQSSSEGTKTSTKHTSPNTQKESNKSQITPTSNTKNARSSQNKSINTKKTKTNNDVDKKVRKSHSNDLKKHVLNKSASELKKLELITERHDLRRNASNKSASSSLRSSSSRRRKSLIRNGDDENDGENDGNADHDDDDDKVPLGFHLRSTKHRPSTSQRNESYDEEVRVRNTPGMFSPHNQSLTPDNPSRRRLSQHSPVATTPPLIHNNSYELLKGPRPHYIRERRISSSASSSSSASVESSGNTRRGIPSNRRFSTYSLPYWNEYDDGEYIHYNHNQYDDDELYDGIVHAPNTPNLPPIERVRRISLNTSPSRQRKDSFSRPPSVGLTTRAGDSNSLVAGANPPPLNRYRKDSGRKLSMTEYHKYQQEMVNAQYVKHGINPVIDDSNPVNLETNNPSRTGPTLMQVQQEYIKTNLSISGNVNTTSVRSKRLSVTDRSYTPSPSESSIQHSRSNKHHHNNPLHLQQFHHSATSLSSSVSSTYIPSSGPPTPTGRRSSLMSGSNVNIVNGSRPGTPVGNGYIPEKEKRRKSILREYT